MRSSVITALEQDRHDLWDLNTPKTIQYKHFQIALISKLKSWNRVDAKPSLCEHYLKLQFRFQVSTNVFVLY